MWSKDIFSKITKIILQGSEVQVHLILRVFSLIFSMFVKEHSCHFIPEALNSPRLDLIFEVSDQIQDQITESQLWPIGSPI